MEAERPVAIVTGSSIGGVGFETARRLALLGYSVVVACRSHAKGAEAAAAIVAAARRGDAASFLPLDLERLASVDAFAAAVLARHERVHVLVLNAGMNTMGASPTTRLTATDTGYEQVFSVNTLAHVALLRFLLPALQRATKPRRVPPVPVRVVFVSSVTHRLVGAAADVDWPAVIEGRALREVGGGGGDRAYGLSKLAMLLLATSLNARLARAHILCLAVNPGAVSSNIWRGAGSAMRAVARALFLTPAQGAATSVAAATATRVHAGTGRVADAAADAGTTGTTPLVGGEYLSPYRCYAGRDPGDWAALAFDALGPFAGAHVVAPAFAGISATAAGTLLAACDVALAAAVLRLRLRALPPWPAL